MKYVVEDILYLRMEHSGFISQTMDPRFKIWKLWDTGDQTCIDRKWSDCVDNISGVIFVASVIDYNQVSLTFLPYKNLKS